MAEGDGSGLPIVPVDARLVTRGLAVERGLAEMMRSMGVVDAGDLEAWLTRSPDVAAQALGWSPDQVARAVADLRGTLAMGQGRPWTGHVPRFGILALGALGRARRPPLND